MSTTIYICPKCGSAAVDIPLVLGGSCRCRACNFTGERTDFPGATVDAPFGGVDTLFDQFAMDVRDAVSKDMAVPLGRILVKYGFMNNPPQVQEMSMYLSAIAKSLAKAMIETREADVIRQVRKNMAS